MRGNNNAQIKNMCTRNFVWVIESLDGQNVAHLLGPGRQSPREGSAAVDPIAVKGADCSIMIPQNRCWTVPPGDLAVINDSTPAEGFDIVTLTGYSETYPSFDLESFEAKFGPVSYEPPSPETDWGEPIDSAAAPPAGMSEPPQIPTTPPVSAPATVANLVQALADATEAEGIYRSLLSIMDALHIGVFEASGEPIIRGAENSVDDFYLYDIELRIIGAAYQRQDRWSLTDFVTMLVMGNFISKDSGTIDAQTISEAIQGDIASALRGPDEQASLVPLLMRELGLHHKPPVDMANRLDPNEVEFDVLQHFLFAVVLMFSALDADTLAGEIEQQPQTFVRAFDAVAPGLTAQQATALAPSSSGPLSDFGDLCQGLRPIGTATRGTVLGAVFGIMVKKLGFALARGIRLMAAVVTDSLHGMVLAYCIKVTIEPSTNYTHYGPPGHYDLAGLPLKFTLRVIMQDSLPRTLVKCGWLVGVTFPPKGPVKRIDVTWFPGSLTTHGAISYDPPDNITNEAGECALNFKPNEEAFPSGGDLTLDTGVVNALPYYLSSLRNWTTGLVAQFLFPKLGMGGWTIEWHKNPDGGGGGGGGGVVDFFGVSPKGGQ